MILDIVIATATGYLFGSIPFAYIVGRLKKGVDIRQIGGGNMGALNTIREIGLLPGLAVLIADIAKGSVAVLIASWLGLPLISPRRPLPPPSCQAPTLLAPEGSPARPGQARACECVGLAAL